MASCTLTDGEHQRIGIEEVRSLALAMQRLGRRNGPAPASCRTCGLVIWSVEAAESGTPLLIDLEDTGEWIRMSAHECDQ